MSLSAEQKKRPRLGSPEAVPEHKQKKPGLVAAKACTANKALGIAASTDFRMSGTAPVSSEPVRLLSEAADMDETYAFEAGRRQVMAGKRELINTGTDKRYVSEETRRVSSKSPMMLDAHSPRM